jgi:hypothetical protein
MAVTVCVLGVCQIPWAQDSKTAKLGSIEECQQKYIRSLVTRNVGGVECFYGKRKDLNEKYALRWNLWKFDTTRLEVAPLLSDEDMAKHFSRGVGDLRMFPRGQHVAATAPTVLPKGGMYFDIVLIDLVGGRCKILVSDGQYNRGLSYSPDGRFIAYWSTDPSMNVDPEKLVPQSAGRVVEEATGEVRTYVNHFMAKGEWGFCSEPIWLDSERVLFATMTTDEDLIKKSGADPSVDRYPYVAVADTVTGKVQGLLIPDGTGVPPQAFLDPQKKCLFLSSQKHLVIKTDFDLANQSTVVEVKEPQRVRVYGFEQDGSLKYRTWEYKKKEPPADLFR